MPFSPATREEVLVVPVYTITFQLLRHTDRQFVDFTSKPFNEALKEAEAFINAWPGCGPCNIKVLLDRRDADYVCELLAGFLSGFSSIPSPVPDIFPLSSPDTLMVTVLFDSSALYAQKLTDKVLQKFEQVVAAKQPFSPFKIDDRLFKYVSHVFHVKITVTGGFVPMRLPY